jgi:two-component system nitrate/nitrite response regulator NarL
MRSTQPAPLNVRVLVADNSVIHTELLAHAIGKDRRIRVVELSTKCEEVLRGVLDANPDVLLISEILDQKPGGGLELISKIRNTHPHVQSIVLLDSSTRETVIQAFRAGARGIFCRNQPVKMLSKCISAVHEGQIWANTSELNFLLEALAAAPSLRPGDAQTLSVLSDRERDVVRCLAEGLSNREIAFRLGISQHTVKNYMFRIFEKLGVSSRLELLFLVLNRTAHVQDVVNQLARNTAEPAPKLSSAKETLDQTKITAIRARTSSQRKDANSRGSAPQLAAGLGSA